MTDNILNDNERKLCDISIKYMERILSGHHPVNNSVIEGNSIVKDENVKRCFAFITDVLKRVYEQPIKQGKSKSKNKYTSATFKPDYKTVVERMIQNREVKMSEMNGLISPYLKDLFVEDIDKVPVARISNWLLDKGYLISVTDETGSNHREASEAGKLIGMTNTLVDYEKGHSYVQYKFTPKAQRFIFENLSEIAVYVKRQKTDN